jgi:hypothetical protein
MNLIDPLDLERLPADVAIFREGLWFDQIWETLGAKAFSWPDYLAQVHQCLQQLRPHPELLQTVEEFSCRHHLKDALGVHIRNTDNLTAYAGWSERSTDFDCHSISSLEGFTGEIRTRLPSMPVFLSTDDHRLEEMLRRTLPGLITFPKQYRTVGARTSPIADALCEMLLLSRCRRIVGTYYSSFSKFAAIWGEAEYFEIRGRECARSGFVDRLLHPPR